jgi:hypothetical protein
MGLLLLIVVLVLLFGGGGYYGHRSGWYGSRGRYVDGPRSGGISLGMFLLLALLLILLFGGIGGPYFGYWHY